MKRFPVSQSELNINVPSRITLIILVTMLTVSFYTGIINIMDQGTSKSVFDPSLNRFSFPLPLEETSSTRQVFVPIQSANLADSSWRSDCTPQKMQIYGIGMGNGRIITNPQTLNLPEPITFGEPFWIQVAGRVNSIESVALPNDITLVLDSGDVLLLPEPFEVTQHSYAFVTSSLNTKSFGQITTMVNGNAKTVRSIVVYALHNSPYTLWTSIGQIMNEFVLASGGHGFASEDNVFTGGSVDNSFSKVITLTYPLPSVTDLEVTAVVIDNDNDERPFNVRLSTDSGIVVTSGLIIAPSHGERLNIVSLAVPNVITDTRSITVTLESPEPYGDSIVLGAVNVNYPCSLMHVVSNTVYLPIVMKPLELLLNVDKSPEIGIVGFPVTHLVSVMNPHTATIAENVKVVYPLPPGFEINWSPSQDWNLSACPSPGQITECTLGDIIPGGTVSTGFYFFPEQAGNIPLVVSAYGTGNTGGSIRTITNVARCAPEFPSDNPLNNDDFNLYWGPLQEGIDYCAGAEDSDDYYYVLLPSEGTLRINVRYEGLYLNKYIPVLQGAVYSEPTKSSRINYSTKNGGDFLFDTIIPAAGLYYVRIYAKDPDPNVSYTMTVQFTP